MGKEAPLPENKSQIPLPAMQALKQTETPQIAFNRPFPMQSTSRPSPAEALATEGMAQKRPDNPALAMQMLRKGY